MCIMLYMPTTPMAVVQPANPEIVNELPFTSFTNDLNVNSPTYERARHPTYRQTQLVNIPFKPLVANKFF